VCYKGIISRVIMSLTELKMQFTIHFNHNHITFAFLEHDERSEERYKPNKCEKMAHKTTVIQSFFCFAPILNLKKFRA
jgi:hypothetical protein